MEVAFTSSKFLTCLSEAFGELFRSKDLTDVTLVFDDQNQLEAHKMILCSWSPVFRSMLTKNPHSHPMIFLKGMSYHNVNSILEFLYMGEVTIPKDSVDEFLSDAEDLQISQFLLDSTEVNRVRDVCREENTSKISQFLIDSRDSTPGMERELTGKEVKLFQEAKTGEGLEETIVELMDNTRETVRSIPEHTEIMTRKSISRREKIYKSSSRYMCEDCSSSYNTRNGLWYHRRSKHQAPATQNISNF